MSIHLSQADIVKAMCVQPHIVPEQEIQKRVQFIQQQLKQAQLTTLVLGISGGVDSSLCGKLCQMAVDALQQNFQKKIINLSLLGYPMVYKKMRKMRKQH